MTELLFHSSCAALPRATASRVCSSTPVGSLKVFSGSNASPFLVAATSSAPSAEPCDLPVFCALGAGQAMTVRSRMKLGWSVTASAARIAS